MHMAEQNHPVDNADHSRVTITTFVILAPHYNPASNGIMLVYNLGALLRELGYHACFYPLNMRDFLLHLHLYPMNILENFIRTADELPVDAAVIMPDTTPPDILADIPCRHRIWYLMNKPWLLTGLPTCYRPDDAVVSYSGLVSKAHFNVFFNRKFTDFDPESQEHQTAILNKRDLILIYAGKSRAMQLDKKIVAFIRKTGAEVICIHRHFPSDRNQLYRLLRSARLLISFDPLTNLNYESTLCGTPCYIPDNYMGIDYADYNISLPGIFEDVGQLSHYYETGISADLQEGILATYRSTTSNHLNTARSLVDYCHQWFSLVRRADSDSEIKALLETHNQIRLENDLLYFKTCKSTAIDSKLQTFVPSVGWTDWLFHSLERYRWYLYRDFVKYVLRLSPGKLAAKLQRYKEARALRAQRRVERKLAGLNIT
jgi:hypothetical protein